MPYTQVILSPDPIYLDPKSYDAKSDRKVLGDVMSPGVVGPSGTMVTGFLVALTTGMGISIQPGVAYVAGQNIADQGMYRQYVSTTSNMTVGAASGANPRLDQVILRVLDNVADASGFNEARLEIVPGTPTAGATLDNRLGAANLTALTDASKSVLLLADILVPTSAGSLVAGNLRDRRAFSRPNRVSGSSTVATHPSAAARPVGYLEYLTDDHGGQLIRGDGSVWSKLGLPAIWVAGIIQYTVSLVTGDLYIHYDADAGTRTTIINNNGVVPAAPSTQLTAPETGYYYCYGTHATRTVGNFGLMLRNVSTGMRLDGRAKTATFGNGGESWGYAYDSLFVSSVAGLAAGVGIDLMCWHDTNNAVDKFEFGIVKLPLMVDSVPVP